MSLRKHLCAAALALGASLSGSAHAVILSSVDAAPGNIVTDFSGAGLLSFDLDLAQAFPATTLTYEIEANDGAQLTFNAIVRNLTGGAIGYAGLSLTQATFGLLGSATRAFGPAAAVAGGGSSATIGFTPPEFFEFYIGDPLGTGIEPNWTLNIAGLRAGDRFSLRLAIPEPATPALVLAGLALALGIARRRR